MRVMFYDEDSSTTFAIFGRFTRVQFSGDTVYGLSPEVERVPLATYKEGKFYVGPQVFDAFAVLVDATDPKA